MSQDVLARALEAYRVESEEAEKRPAETLRRILSARQERRRVKPLLWVALLTCSAGAAARPQAWPHLPWRVRIVPTERARSAGVSPIASPVPVVHPDLDLNPPDVRPVPAVSGARIASPPRTSRVQRDAPSPVVAAIETSTQAEPTPATTPFNPEDLLFEQARKAHDSVPVEDDLAGWERYLRAYPDGRFAPEARYRRALALARMGRNTQALSAFLWFTDREEGSSRREDALRWIRALSQER
jgi:hypothetical protein